MTWAQIRQHFLQIVGDTAAGGKELYDHLSEGYRTVATLPEVMEAVPELAAIDESVSISSGTDYAAMSAVDFDAFAILDVFNKTQGMPVEPEPGGMTGRRRYLDTTGKPPSGVVTHYQRDGSRLYVRNTPDATTVLIVRVQRQVPTITVADLNSSPLTPAQYDWPIVFYAAANYYSVHPRIEGDPQVNFALHYRDLAREKIASRANPRKEEDRPRRETMRVRGYSMAPRSRWGR